MFFTQPAAEWPPAIPFDLQIKRWAIVQRGLHTPWFHLSIAIEEQGVQLLQELLVADISELCSLLAEMAPHSIVRSVMAMLPPHLTGAPLWSLEHVVAVDMIKPVKSGGESRRLTLEDGRKFEFSVSQKDLDQVTTSARLYTSH